MPRPPNSDLINFVNWLVDEEYFTKKTAQVYASSIRSTLKKLNSMTQEEITRVFVSLSKAQDYRFTSWKCAWAKFVRWSATQDVKIPMPEVSHHSSSFPSLPDDVRESLVKLMRKGNRLNGIEGMGLPPTTIERLCWGNVQPPLGGSQVQRVRDPHGKGGHFLIPCDWIEPLGRYAKATSDHSPLIPISPGGEDPYPARALKREALSHKRSQS